MSGTRRTLPPSTATGPTLGCERLHEGEFHKRLAAQPGLTLVMFAQPGCGACRRAEAVLPGWLAGAVQRLVHVDAAAQAALAREFEVFHLPALHLYKDGQYHAPLNTEMTATAVRAAVAVAAAAPAREAP